MKSMKIRITFTEEVLGTASNNPELFSDYIASKAPDAKTTEEEIEDLGVDGKVEKSMTIFPKQNGVPFLYDYQIKGFLKDSCKALRKVPGTVSSKVKAYKQEIDGLVFPKPRKIPIVVAGELGICERPLRASTPMGERIALSISESCPEGSWIELEIVTLTDNMEDLARECLDYGALRGIGQWRNSGKGRFTWEELG